MAIPMMALVAILATPAGADWLVMTDGARVETDGPWEQRGALIVFTTPDGTLSSLKADEVDLEASHRATAEAARAASEAAEEAAEEPEPVEREPILVLTDADFGHVDPAAAGGEEAADAETGSAAETGSDADSPPRRLEVVEWERLEDPAVDGAVVTGRLRNQSEATVVGVGLTATAYGGDGEERGSTTAELSATSLGPGNAATFRVVFSGVYSISDVVFTTEGTALETASGEPPSVRDEIPER